MLNPSLRSPLLVMLVWVLMSRDWGSFGGRLRFAADTLSTNPPTHQTPTMERFSDAIASLALNQLDNDAFSFLCGLVCLSGGIFDDVQEVSNAVHKQTRLLPGLLRLHP